MKDWDNFSGLTSFCGGLLAIFLYLAVENFFMLADVRAFLIFSFSIALLFPYLFCSCRCGENSIFSPGGLGALTGSAVGWGLQVFFLYMLGLPPKSMWLDFWFLMCIPIFAFLFSRYYCMILKKDDKFPVLMRFLSIFGGLILSILGFIFILYSMEMTDVWFVAIFLNAAFVFSFLALFFWSIFLYGLEGTIKYIPRYLNNVGVTFIVLTPFILCGAPYLFYQGCSFYIFAHFGLLFLLLTFSLKTSIERKEKAYLYDTLSIMGVAIILFLLTLLSLNLLFKA